jgi:CubicO group peptidase (beta-lactamase class C family)
LATETGSDQSAAAWTHLAGQIADGRHAGITSFHLFRDGRALAGYTSPAMRGASPDLRSATKSITALLVGIALQRKHIPSLGTRVATLLPAYRAELEKDSRKAAITVEDLLTMRSGLDCDDWVADSPGHEDTMYGKRDWLAHWATVPIRDQPGTRFAYCTGNVIALGAIVDATSGKSLDDFADQYLFGPLGIGDVRWSRYDRGKAIDAGGHLHMQPRDLLKIGELILTQGNWRGLQIVSAQWIAEMTTMHTTVPGRNQRYGYLWWIDETRQPNLPKTRLFLAWGNGGNFLIVIPELNAVAAFTGTRFNRPDALEPLHWMRDRILPNLRNSSRAVE